MQYLFTNIGERSVVEHCHPKIVQFLEILQFCIASSSWAKISKLNTTFCRETRNHNPADQQNSKHHESTSNGMKIFLVVNTLIPRYHISPSLTPSPSSFQDIYWMRKSWHDFSEVSLTVRCLCHNALRSR